MNFDLADEDAQLADVIDKLLQADWALEVLKDPKGSPEAAANLWTRFGELGLTTLLLPENDGGSGGTVMQARLVARALGRHLAPTAFVWGSVLPAIVLSNAAAGDLRSDLLQLVVDEQGLVVPGFTSNEHTLAQFPSAWLDFPGVSSSEFKRVVVPHGLQARAALILDAVSVIDGIATVPVLNLGSPSADVNAQKRSDLQEVAVARVDHTSAELPGLEIALVDLVRGVAALKVAIAALAVGGLSRACELASDYAAAREQFGRPIGAFQAVAHRCVDMRARADSDETLCDVAAWQIDNEGVDAVRLGALAKARATRDFVEGSTGALHVFAGHGFSLESDIQLFYRFARGLEASWGTPDAEYASNPRRPSDERDDITW
jgi:alkylation response protein AidB-like acyl-CoA dehydrogenase